jgi:electron transfer flavoprotein alpha subunit
VSIWGSQVARGFAAQPRFASSLVLGEHDGSTLSVASRSAITAATELGGDVYVLVCGADAASAVESASKVAGVSKVRPLSAQLSRAMVG